MSSPVSFPVQAKWLDKLRLEFPKGYQAVYSNGILDLSPLPTEALSAEELERLRSTLGSQRMEMTK